MKSKVVIIFSIVAVLAIGGFIGWRMFGLSDSDSVTTEEIPVNEEIASQGVEVNEPDVVFEEKTEAPEETKQKKPQPPTTVTATEPPLVYTGYGHSDLDPLLGNQETSTTCTTVAGAECFIRFEDGSGNTVTFDPAIADNQGVAVWDWVGSDVGPGTWTAYAITGDLTSQGEVLYIQ